MMDRDEIHVNRTEENGYDPARGDEGQKSSVYSYNYRDGSMHAATHQGDYDAKRDSASSASCNSNMEHRASDWSRESRSYYNPQDQSVYRSQPAGNPKPQKEKKKGGFLKTLGKCVILAAVFGLVAGGVFQGVARIGMNGDGAGVTSVNKEGAGLIVSNGTIDSTAVSTAVTVTDVSDIVDNVMPAIVSITSISQMEYYNMFGQSQRYEDESAGSGIIVAEDDTYLYIVTNNHVVENASSLTISFVDEQMAAAVVKGKDPSTDLAVVSVEKASMEPETLANIKLATLGDSDSLRVGESAVAIGNALGYGQSVTTGVISALDREVTTTDANTGSSVTNELIQTDAAINPGNSGGALLNMNGEVIGINSVKYSDTSVEGMGYAIPIKTAQPIINELITREKVEESKSAYLGISGVDVTKELSQAYNMPEGIFVAQVSQGSAADQAGIKSGDIIISFDGKTVKSMESLKELLQYYEAGQTVDVIVTYAERDRYVEETISVTLGSKVE